MTFGDFIDRLIGLLNGVVPIIFGLSVVMFLYGLVVYITKAGDASNVKNATKYISFGLLGMFVMLSIWGLASILSGTFGLTVGIPQIGG